MKVHVPQYSLRGTTCFMPPKSLKSLWFDAHTRLNVLISIITFTSDCTILITTVILKLTSQCMPLSGLTSFHPFQFSTAKIAPSMYQNLPFELKNRKNFLGGRSLSRPLPSPHTLLSRGLRRLYPRAYGPRPSPNLQQKSPPLSNAQWKITKKAASGV